jgi:hypothetical protein
MIDLVGATGCETVSTSQRRNAGALNQALIADGFIDAVGFAEVAPPGLAVLA